MSQIKHLILGVMFGATKTNRVLLVSCFCFCFVLPFARAVCTFPTSLRGQWYSTSNGVLTFTDSQFTGYQSSLTTDILTFDCHILTSSGKYIAKAEYQPFNNINLYAYLCMNLEELSNIKYKYTLDNNLDLSTSVRVYTDASSTVGETKACNFTDTRSDGEYEILILVSSVTSASIECPSVFQITYTNITMLSNSGGNTCYDTNVTSVEANKALFYTYSSCVTTSLKFTSGGVHFCVYSSPPYLTVFNNDSTIDEPNTYRFSCLNYEKPAATVFATESPKTCQQTQTTTSISTTGVIYTMFDPDYVAPTSPEESNVVIIVVAVLCVLTVIGIIAIIIFCYWYHTRPVVRPPKPRKKRVPEVHEHSPRKYDRRDQKRLESAKFKRQELDILPGAKKDGTVVSQFGVFSDATFSGNYTPQWQRRWEETMRPPPENKNISQLLDGSVTVGGGSVITPRIVEKEPDAVSTSSTVIDTDRWLQSNERRTEPWWGFVKRLWNPEVKKSTSDVDPYSYYARTKRGRFKAKGKTKNTNKPEITHKKAKGRLLFRRGSKKRIHNEGDKVIKSPGDKAVKTPGQGTVKKSEVPPV